MHLVYLDESGNSGNNLNDSQQPVFVLCAMIVPENQWLKLERELAAAVDKHFPRPRPNNFEVHGTELRTARGFCKGMSVGARVAFRDEWMDIAAENGVKLIHRAIDKKRYQKWLHATFGTGVVINPHVAAFASVARVVDDYLNALPGPPLGMFISDDNKEIVADVEKSIRVLRGTEGTLRLSQIIEKGFFIDSAHSLPLQLCDVFALSLRKHEEIKTGKDGKSVDESGIKRALSLTYRGIESQREVDVIAWLTQQHS
ncbi:MAG TPA: DUF3800 domain-containing protein [Phycisphaerae bacterium]|nr:DUF3800 domain-containing protein [Phycisphaerae bacterium]